MNFDLDEKDIALRKKLGELVDLETKAAFADLEQGDAKHIRRAVSDWLVRLGQLGYLGLGLEKGDENLRLLAAQETLATQLPSLFLSVEASTRIFGRLVALFGTPEQKHEILSPLKEGRLIGALGLSEGSTSVENNPLNTKGTVLGDHVQVSGSKDHVVNGPIADLIAVGGSFEENLVFFLVSTQTHGLSIAQRLSTLGYNGATISPISLKNCPLPSKYLITPPDGQDALKLIRMWEDQVLTAASLGLMQGSFDAALNYAKDHRSGGKPIIAYQEVGFKLAEMLTLLQTAQLLAYRAAWMADAGNREARLLSLCAKVFCTESAEELASHALQILGGRGYVRGNLAEEGYRNAKYLSIAGTSSEISRVKIGDQVLEAE